MCINSSKRDNVYGFHCDTFCTCKNERVREEGYGSGGDNHKKSTHQINARLHCTFPYARRSGNSKRRKQKLCTKPKIERFMDFICGRIHDEARTSKVVHGTSFVRSTVVLVLIDLVRGATRIEMNLPPCGLAKGKTHAPWNGSIGKSTQRVFPYSGTAYRTDFLVVAVLHLNELLCRFILPPLIVSSDSRLQCFNVQKQFVVECELVASGELVKISCIFPLWHFMN